MISVGQDVRDQVRAELEFLVTEADVDRVQERLQIHVAMSITSHIAHQLCVHIDNTKPASAVLLLAGDWLSYDFRYNIYGPGKGTYNPYQDTTTTDYDDVAAAFALLDSDAKLFLHFASLCYHYANNRVDTTDVVGGVLWAFDNLGKGHGMLEILRNLPPLAMTDGLWETIGLT